MAALRAVRRLFSLSPRALTDLALAELAIVNASWRLRRVRIGELVSNRQRESPASTDAKAKASTPAQPEKNATQREDAVPGRARELALALERAAEHGFMRPECLVRSLALRSLLEWSGIQGGEIRVGVCISGKELLAHAWLELHGTVLGDREAFVSRFVPIQGLSVRGL